MKWMFLLLLVANVAYFLFADRLHDDGRGAGPAPTPEPDAAGVATILLISEATEQGLFPLPEPPAVVAPTPPVTSPDPSTADEQTAESGESSPMTAPGSLQPEPQPEPTEPAQQTDGGDHPPPSPAEPADNHVDTAQTDDLARQQTETPDQTAAADDDPAGGRTDSQETPTDSTGVASAGDTAGQSVDAADHPSPPQAPAPSDQQPEDTPPAVTGPPPSDAPETTQHIDQQPPICHRLGPFPEAATASDARQRASELGITQAAVRSARQPVFNYKLYLGPYESPTQREYDQRELEASGYQSISLEPIDNLPSLVIVRTPNRKEAEATLADLRGLGYNPRLNRMAKPKIRYYLAMETPRDDNSLDLLQQLQTEFPDIPLKSADCPRLSQ